MTVNNLTYSRKGLALTEQFEGCRLSAYKDQVGVWTIGYGHTEPDVKPGITITNAQAEALLAQDVKRAESCVNNLVSVQLTQQEFDALVDFIFNLGTGAFSSSTMLRELMPETLRVPQPNSISGTAQAAQWSLDCSVAARQRRIYSNPTMDQPSLHRALGLLFRDRSGFRGRVAKAI